MLIDIEKLVLKDIVIFGDSLVKLDPDFIKGLIYGMIEITNGIYLISLSNLDILTQLLLTAFLINFGGLCVFMQTKNVTTDTNINLKLYLIIKFISGIISVGFTYILFKLFTT